MSEIQDDLAGAIPVTAAAIAAVGEEQWSDPSTCTDWNVRDLVEHLVGGVWLTASVLAGEGATGRPDQSEMADHALANAFTEAGGRVVATLAEPDVLQRPVRVGMGPVPGVVAAQLCLVETLVHGWDVARSTGADVTFDQGTVQRTLDFSKAMMSQIPEGRSPFAEERHPAAGASPLEQLIALLGRESR
ncbi:MAG: TIGR03086 family metal-binding protein [Ornithinimicrobium sp.]